ncbi:hypothetical protein P7H62_13340 [Vagococcus carniphilus]|uniref:Uncharacterized protein n=1 Tax=Vagococcus carniphilus TaxID=218144 RepID=A0AAW8U6L3_9ENTE|nr:hypothetical protein [Vagococcus carniphilus]MDT2831934.1 hypothetical protein [Vagococcus carniphilus]MDT2833775.1 hypothetical protein [Vagococcus carniphilus]MDT2840780.1 hypothetical protein [Vagococcus carniphilus]MDT2855444.1 hypothetical protein [Vagococcus carniphilus]
MKKVKLKVIISSLLIGTVLLGGNSLPILNEEITVEASGTNKSQYFKDGRAYAQWGVTTIDLESTDGYFYPAGTIVARASRNVSNAQSGSFFLSFTVSAFFFIGTGEVPEQYVSVTESKIVNAQKDDVRLVNNPIAPGAIHNPLQPAKPVVELDTSALTASINEAEAIKKNGVSYTSDSMSLLNSALTNGYNVVGNPNTDQGTINSANQQLRNAINGMVEAPAETTDKSALGALINESRTAMNNPQAYTQATFDLFAKQYNNASAIFNNPGANQYDIDNAESALRYRFKKLELSGEGPINPVVNKIALQASIKAANAKLANSGKYTVESINVVKTSKANAERVEKDVKATQTQVDKATKELEKALNNLALRDVAAKGALKNTIGAAKTALKNEATYTDQSVKTTKSSLAKAEKVMADKDATQAQVDKATADLQKAVLGLKKKTEEVKVNKIKLEASIKDANKILKNGAKYTEKSVKVVKDSKADAEKVMTNSKATQAQVNLATTNLDKAIASLKVKSEKPEGNYIKDKRYVTFINGNYNTWSNFNWKHRESGKNLVNKTFITHGKYSHKNGSTYVSLHDNKGKWHGYVNEKAIIVGKGSQGAYIKDGRFVTLTKKNYNTWSNFNWKYKFNGKDISNRTFISKGKYYHQNGSVYLSLFDNKGKWYGYINEKAVAVGKGSQGAYVKDGRRVIFSKSNYNTWSNFNWKYKVSGKNMVNKTFVARGKYYHQNGSTYLSLFDDNGRWYGYVNEVAVKVK